MDKKDFDAICVYLEKNDSEESLRGKTKERIALTAFNLSSYQKSKLFKSFSCVQKYFYGRGCNSYRLYVPVALNGLFQSPEKWILKQSLEKKLEENGLKTKTVKI